MYYHWSLLNVLILTSLCTDAAHVSLCGATMQSLVVVLNVGGHSVLNLHLSWHRRSLGLHLFNCFPIVSKCSLLTASMTGERWTAQERKGKKKMRSSLQSYPIIFQEFGINRGIKTNQKPKEKKKRERRKLEHLYTVNKYTEIFFFPVPAVIIHPLCDFQSWPSPLVLKNKEQGREEWIPCMLKILQLEWATESYKFSTMHISFLV